MEGVRGESGSTGDVVFTAGEGVEALLAPAALIACTVYT
jgi:hypothetical protein